MSTPARKAVKCITIGGISGGIYSASVADGRNTTNGEIAAYGDSLYTTIASPVLHAADLTVDVINEGGEFSAIKSLVGTTKDVSITATYWNGSSTVTDTVLSGACVILSADGDSVPVDDYGRSLIHVTLRKQATASDVISGGGSN